MGTPLRATLMLGLRFDNDVWWKPDALRYRHKSNAGSGDPNAGWDMANLVWDVW